MLHPVLGEESFKWLVTKMCTHITDYGFGYSKYGEDVLFEKFENNSVIISFASDCFYPFRNIIHSHQNVGIDKGHRKRFHEVNAPYIKKINY